MGYGLKLKKPSYAKGTEVLSIDSIPEVLIRLDERHTPTVSKGERVLVGQPIASSPSDTTPLYSSVSGNVLGIVNIDEKDHIKIENDGKYESAPSPVPTDIRLSQMSRDEMIERIRLCAVPIWKKLAGSESIHHLVLDCLDRDQYCSDVKCAVKNCAHEIIGGVKILLRLLALDNCEIVIEKGNSARVNDLLEYIGESTLFGLTETEGIYHADERDRIVSALPSLSSIPYEEVCVIDVHSAAAVYRAFSKGTPYLRRFVSVGGTYAIRGGCYDLPLGTPISTIADHTAKKHSSDLSDDPPERFCIGNGAMTGALIDTETSCVDADTRSLVFITEDELSSQTGSCIGCGKCDRACPDRLNPSLFVRSCEADFDSAVKASGMDRCSACGACSYVCPARIPIHEVAQGNTELLRPDRKYTERKLTSAPFIRDPDTARSMNLDLIFALCALIGWAVCKFGIRALIICAVSVVCAVVSDIVFNILTKNGVRTVLDLGSVVCGLSCALVMSINTPLYAVALASFFAIMTVRGIFGGTGRNIIHSVFCARILVSMFWHESFVYNSGRNYTMFDHLLGNTDGALGEVSFILLIACALYLIYRHVICALPSGIALAVFTLITFLSAPVGSDAVDYATITTVSSAITLVCVFCSSERSVIPSATAGRVAWGVLCGSVAAIITRYTIYEGAYAAAVLASAVTVPLFRRIGRVESTPLSSASEPPEAEDEDVLEGEQPPADIEGEQPSAENENTAEADKASDNVAETSEEAVTDTKVTVDAENDGEFNIEVDKLIDAISAEIGLSDEDASDHDITNK